MERQIFGTEMEYAISVRFGEQAPDEWGTESRPAGFQVPTGFVIMGLVDRCLPEDYPRLPHARGPGLMDGRGHTLGNGARLYPDMQHPEYATQEVDDLEALFAAETAGEEIVYEVFREAMVRKWLSGFVLNKRVVDFGRQVFGYHENYLAERHLLKPEEKQLWPLALHLATRTVFAGAGAIVSDGAGGGQFVLGQKIQAADCDYYLDTFPKRAVMNLRDEPQADKERFVRLHVTSGDPHTSPAAAKLQRGSTGLVIRAMQQGYKNERLLPKANRLHVAAQIIAADLTLNHGAVELDRGSNMTAIEVQREFHALVHQMLEREGGSPEDWEVFALWGNTLDQLENGNRDIHKVRAAGWLSRYALLRESMEERELSPTPEGWADPQLRTDDIRYDRLGRKSVTSHLRATVWKDDMPPRELIDFYKAHGSPATRSGVRSAYVQLMSGRKRAAADWGTVTLPDGNIVKLDDPRQTESRELNEFVAAYRSAGAFGSS